MEDTKKIEFEVILGVTGTYDVPEEWNDGAIYEYIKDNYSDIVNWDKSIVYSLQVDVKQTAGDDNTDEILDKIKEKEKE